jgi:hypothetical protein
MEPISMILDPSQQVFMLFYAIFWGAVANVQPRWKAFQLPLIGLVPKVGWRTLLSFVLLNVVPLIFFAYVLWVLPHKAVDFHFSSYLWLSIQGVVPAFAVFGFYRLWLGVVEMWPERFYHANRKGDLNSNGTEELEEKYWHVEPIYRTDHKKTVEQPFIDIGTNSALRNIMWALLYILVGVVAPFPFVSILPLNLCG